MKNVIHPKCYSAPIAEPVKYYVMLLINIDKNVKTMGNTNFDLNFELKNLKKNSNKNALGSEFLISFVYLLFLIWFCYVIMKNFAI